MRRALCFSSLLLSLILAAGLAAAAEPDADKDGIVDAVDKCPNEPEDLDGFEDADGCPDADHDGHPILDEEDADKDGIVDARDKCPNDPEDLDGFEDADGCPDPDNDGDRIPDTADKCPNDPENFNGSEDEDGCPDRRLVKISESRIEILDGSSMAPAASPSPRAHPAPPPGKSARRRRASSAATPIAAVGGGKKPLQVAAPAAGRLTAGEWRDIDHWSFWSDLRRRQTALTPDRALAKFDLVADHLITVTLRADAKRVAIDAPVRLYDGGQRLIAEGRTNAFGQAHLVFGSARAPLSLDVAGQRHAVQPGQQLEFTINAPAPAPILDVMLVVDVTGSMCDELSWLQREMTDVLERALEETPNLALRTAANAYRDHGDQFVVKAAPFRKTPAAAIADLNAVACGGGGDTPEAVDDALIDALESHDWSPNATGRLLFLVLDAPPHQTSAVKARLKRSIAVAQKKGVRIVAVAGSGIDKTAEFFLRGASALTGGTYVFLTDHSGIGNSHIKPTVGPHAIESLNDLMVRLIREAAGVRVGAPEHAAGQ